MRARNLAAAVGAFVCFAVAAALIGYGLIYVLAPASSDSSTSALLGLGLGLVLAGAGVALVGFLFLRRVLGRRRIDPSS